MKYYLLPILGLLVLSGCATEYVHSKNCLPEEQDGYQWCHHYIEYWTHMACVGSCEEGKK